MIILQAKYAFYKYRYRLDRNALPEASRDTALIFLVIPETFLTMSLTVRVIHESFLIMSLPFIYYDQRN